MATTTARIPDEVLHGAKAIASLQGRTVNEVLVDAWRQYFDTHRDEIAAGVEHAAQLLRAGDIEGLVAHANRDAHERAARTSNATE